MLPLCTWSQSSTAFVNGLTKRSEILSSTRDNHETQDGVSFRTLLVAHCSWGQSSPELIVQPIKFSKSVPKLTAQRLRYVQDPLADTWLLYFLALSKVSQLEPKDNLIGPSLFFL